MFVQDPEFDSVPQEEELILVVAEPAAYEEDTNGSALPLPLPFPHT
jgi:hypothetical protein